MSAERGRVGVSEEEERHGHGGGDAWSPSEAELQLARTVRHWRRAWGAGLLAVPCILAGLTGEQVEWIALVGILLWAGSLAYATLGGLFLE